MMGNGSTAPILYCELPGVRLFSPKSRERKKDAHLKNRPKFHFTQNCGISPLIATQTISPISPGVK